MSVTLETSSPTLDRRRLISALESVARTERGNGVVFRRAASWLGRAPGPGRGMIVSVDEWERLWPSRECPALGEREIAGSGSWVLPLGRVSTGAVVGPRVEPGQGRHLAVLGETGMGKSSLLVALGRRVFDSCGGVVFDPLGETVRLLRDELTSGARARLLWIAPGEDSVGVNALEGIDPAGPFDPIRTERRVNDLVHALRRVRAGRYEDSSYWGPRLEEMVTRAVRAAAALPRGTLIDAHTLLATGGRLGRPVPGPAIEPVRELADRIRDRPEDADGARRLLHEVVRSPVLRRMLCEPEPDLRTRDLVAPGRIVLISGDAGMVGEPTARYLLSVYLALVWSELLAREEVPKTFVVLDEAQWFSHESLGEMLRLGRRRNVHVMLATQAVGSLPPAVRDAVWTNVSDFVAFRGSPEEAREFSRASRAVPAEDLLALPRGEAAVLLGKGHFVRWVKTIRLPGPPATRTEGADLPTSPLPSSSETGCRTTPKGDDRTPCSEPGDRTKAVLRYLAGRAEHVVPGNGLEVRLEDLRREVDPDGTAVRRVGSLLGRRGIVTRAETRDSGPVWVVPPDRVADLRAYRTKDSEPPSDTAQPS
ncbi:MAG: helicase HerA domain-containing protein [Thermoplasmata archaeon]